MLWRISQFISPGHNFWLKFKISELSHVCNMPFSSCVLWFDHPNVFSYYTVDRPLTDRAWHLHSFMPLIFFRHVDKLWERPLASSPLSVPPHGTPRLPLDGFSWNFIFNHFSKNLWRCFKFHSIRTKVTGPLHENKYTFLSIFRWDLRIMRNISDKSCRVSQNTHCVFNIAFRRSCSLRDIVDYVYCKAWQAADDNMAHVQCMLDTQDFKHTLTIRNNYCSSTVTMFAWTRLNVILCHCLPCFSCISSRTCLSLFEFLSCTVYCTWPKKSYSNTETQHL
jgi:hypothetical protein